MRVSSCRRSIGRGIITRAVAHPVVRSLAADGPMLPTLVDGLPRREGWRYEPKWDGWRAIAVVDGGRVDLRSRRATDLAPYFPELLRPPVALADRRAVLDGEVVVLRDGRPDFDAISRAGWPPGAWPVGLPIPARPRSSPSTCSNWTGASSLTRRTRLAGRRSRASASTASDGR
jgi:hypothetical protein